jgi:hypothetical protein
MHEAMMARYEMTRPSLTLDLVFDLNTKNRDIGINAIDSAFEKIDATKATGERVHLLYTRYNDAR